MSSKRIRDLHPRELLRRPRMMRRRRVGGARKTARRHIDFIRKRCVPISQRRAAVCAEGTLDVRTSSVPMRRPRDEMKIL
jgi:hypothetical protein